MSEKVDSRAKPTNAVGAKVVIDAVAVRAQAPGAEANVARAPGVKPRGASVLEAFALGTLAGRRVQASAMMERL